MEQETNGHPASIVDDVRDRVERGVNEMTENLRGRIDWRGNMDRNPWLCLGVAFGAGMALSALLAHPDSYGGYRAADYRMSKRWQAMQAALLAVVSRKAEEYINEAVPGFRDEYRAQSELHS